MANSRGELALQVIGRGLGLVEDRRVLLQKLVVAIDRYYNFAALARMDSLGFVAELCAAVHEEGGFLTFSRRRAILHDYRDLVLIQEAHQAIGL